MRIVIFSTLILFSVAIGPHINTKDRVKTQTAENRRELNEDCSTPDRPKPAVEREMQGDVLCGKSISLPKPPYPEEAKAKGISGIVRVRVVADENGNVIWAKAIEGHPLLQEASIKAACQSKYSPEKISGRPIKVTHVITYNFVNQ